MLIAGKHEIPNRCPPGCKIRNNSWSRPGICCVLCPIFQCTTNHPYRTSPGKDPAKFPPHAAAEWALFFRGEIDSPRLRKNSLRDIQNRISRISRLVRDVFLDAESIKTDLDQCDVRMPHGALIQIRLRLPGHGLVVLKGSNTHIPLDPDEKTDLIGFVSFARGLYDNWSGKRKT